MAKLGLRLFNEYGGFLSEEGRDFFGEGEYLAKEYRKSKVSLCPSLF